MKRPPSGVDLEQILGIERGCCDRLKALLEAERTAAATYSLNQLRQCLKEREAIQAEWQRAVHLRTRITKADRALAAALENDPKLSGAVAGLRRDVAILRRAQGINQSLLRAALAQVSDLLDVVRRELPESRYDGRASLTNVLPPARRAGWSA